MNYPKVRTGDSIAFIGLVCACALIISASLFSQPVSAAAVSASSLTATSSNVYVNSGLATTTRITTGDQVRYQLTTSGTPLIAPQINIFSMGSTTMSGSGTNWFYASTSVTTWTEGAITFSLGIGGTAGDATTTVTHTSLSGTNVTYDKTAPTLSSVSWSDVDASTQFSATDTLTFTFSETMATSTIASGNVDTRLGLSGSHTFGTSPTVSWNSAGTILTLTLGTSPSVATADTVDPTTDVKDSVGIADATAAALTITDSLAPSTPTGLDYINFRESISVSLASTGSSQIRYTTDGTTPTCSTGTAFSSALTITETTTIKAVGCDEASNTSSVATGIYTLSSSGGTGRRTSREASPAPSAPTTPEPSENLRVPTPPAASTTFMRDLTGGMQGEDVKALQVWLNAHGYPIAATGPGSPGNETDYFGALTKAAVAAYQKAKAITPTAGYFGPKTRAAVIAEQ